MENTILSVEEAKAAVDRAEKASMDAYHAHRAELKRIYGDEAEAAAADQRMLGTPELVDLMRAKMNADHDFEQAVFQYDDAVNAAAEALKTPQA